MTKKGNSAAAAGGKEKEPPMKWTAGETTRFIRVFTKQKKTKKEQGTGGGTGMSGPGWNVILEAMNKDAPAGVIYKKNHLQNKIPTLSKDYWSNEFLLKKTGLGINATTGAFTGSTEVQNEIGETDKNALKFFKAPLLNYALLDELLRSAIIYSFSFLSIYFLCDTCLVIHFFMRIVLHDQWEESNWQACVVVIVDRIRRRRDCVPEYR